MKNSFRSLYTIGFFLSTLCTAHAATTVTPKITTISVTPTSAPAGTMFKFSATLNAPLTESSKVKVDLGKGFETMTGTKTSYSLSRAIYTTGTQSYKIGIYDSKNVLQDVVKNGSYIVTSATSVNHAPTLTLTKADTSATVNTIYTVTLNAKDKDANLNAITLNWGDSSAPDTLTATDGKDLVFSHTYKTDGTFAWTAFASDKGTPALNSASVSKTITVTPVISNAASLATTGYTKIANDGSILPDNAALGTKPKDWACTKDNKTGLIWEVKTADGGLRDANKTYSNRDEKNSDRHNTQEPTAQTFVADVNAATLCGANDWRLPTIDELSSLVFCSSGQYEKVGSDTDDDGNVHDICPENTNNSNPTINTKYFPNTLGSLFWSSSSYENNNNYGWIVAFSYGSDIHNAKGDDFMVRLVRNGQ